MTTSVVGIDLGHAETAGCRGLMGDVREPQTIELAPAQRSIPSAVATAADGALLIGSEAILAPDACDLALAFKSMDMRDREASVAMERFARGLVHRLQALGEIDSAGGTEIVVGVPSAWPELARLEYRTLLQRAGLPGVRLIAESRAALLSAGVSYEQAKAEVLIVDIGSSTTDVTFLTELSLKSGGPRELGHNRLGGGLIDEAMLEVLVARSSERHVIDDIFAQDNGARARALFAVRKAKEDYFTHETVHRRHPLVKAHYVSARPRVLLDIEIDAETVERIISQPITLGLDGAPGGAHTLSWRQAYTELMAKARAQGSPRTVVLTGGASRMAFVHEITRESFPGARVVVGSEPELAIARGLAQSGRIDIHTAMFTEDAERTFRPALIESAVRQRYPDWKEAIATLYVAELSNILAASLRRWGGNQDSILKPRGPPRGAGGGFPPPAQPEGDEPQAQGPAKGRERCVQPARQSGGDAASGRPYLRRLVEQGNGRSAAPSRGADGAQSHSHRPGRSQSYRATRGVA